MHPEERIGFLLKRNYTFIERYIIEGTRGLLKAPRPGDPDALIEASGRAYNFQSFVNIAVHGYPEITNALEQCLISTFGSKNVLTRIIEENLIRAFKNISGHCRIRSNNYVICNGEIYYRSFSGPWYRISSAHVFDLLPRLEEEAGPNIAARLEEAYQMPEPHALYETWKKKPYKADIPPELFEIKSGATTPEEYAAHSMRQISAFLRKPVALAALTGAHRVETHFIEHVCKITYHVAHVVAELRDKTTHTLYLLRDGLMLAEAHKIVDLLLGEPTASSQILINRKLLSVPGEPERQWQLTVDALFSALRDEPTGFSRFYQSYEKHMRKQEEADPQLRRRLDELATYIEGHVADIIGKKNIHIVDTGFQGSIVMLTKYLIDGRIAARGSRRFETDVYLCTTDDWFYPVYAERSWNECNLAKELESTNRSAHLYTYKDGSIGSGRMKVIMGPADKQILANIELMVMTTMLSLMHERGILPRRI